VELQLHSFLTSALDGDECQLKVPAALVTERFTAPIEKTAVVGELGRTFVVVGYFIQKLQVDFLKIDLFQRLNQNWGLTSSF